MLMYGMFGQSNMHFTLDFCLDPKSLYNINCAVGYLCKARHKLNMFLDIFKIHYSFCMKKRLLPSFYAFFIVDGTIIKKKNLEKILTRKREKSAIKSCL